MKLNLLLDNPKSILNGYSNIDPLKNNAVDERISGDVLSLDWFCDDAECEQIIAREILSYFPIKAQGTILHNWLKKIKKGGEFVYEQLDFESLCGMIYLGKIPPKDAQVLFYGEQDKNWNIKKSCLSIIPLVDFLQGSGFKVTQKRFENINFCVSAVRL